MSYKYEYRLRLQRYAIDDDTGEISGRATAEAVIEPSVMANYKGGQYEFIGLISPVAYFLLGERGNDEATLDIPDDKMPEFRAEIRQYNEHFADKSGPIEKGVEVIE